MLATGAILDYGSIRQFASKHDKYRYDDTDRFSTSLSEQKFWARELAKVFAQACHFARTGRKRNLGISRTIDASSSLIRGSNATASREQLWQLGFTPEQIESRSAARTEIGDLRLALSFFEKVKVARGIERLPMASRIARFSSSAICCATAGFST